MNLLLALCGFLWLLSSKGSCIEDKSNDYASKSIKTASVDIHIRQKEIHINIRKQDGSGLDHVLLTEGDFPSQEADHAITEDCELFTTCISRANVTHTKIKTDPTSDVIQISRGLPNNTSGRLIDCSDLSNDTDWFAGPQQRNQIWPTQWARYEQVPYVPSHAANMAVAERYWLSSAGIYLHVAADSPLFIDQNNYKPRHLCLIAEDRRPYRKRELLSLSYEIGVLADPRKAHESHAERHYPKPKAIPNERMITHPIWSTWARYKVNVDESMVKALADEILAHGFDNSQIEIDDNWETCYGSATFDEGKFPNVTGLVNHLKEMGFRVSLWIHPFVNFKCDEAWKHAKENKYLVQNTNGLVYTKWWQGFGAAIDFTNAKAVDWFLGRMRRLQALGFDTFKFDAGESSWLPQITKLDGPVDLQPALYTSTYASLLAKHFDDSIEVRSAWNTQDLPIFVRMIDKDTTWSWDNGLPTLITTLLQMNLNGYSFVLPDMIGGNGYTDSFNSTKLPSKQLFIRWLQANVFMPALQYSFVPWDFDDETVSISKIFTDLHADVSPLIIRLMRKFLKTGAPVNPPIWWVDPLDKQAHKINDEYLLGEEILVAPVITENSTARDIYLPLGRWQDANYKGIYTGPTWIYNYSAPLSVLPYFHKID